MSMSQPYSWTCLRPLTASLTTCYWGNCERTDSQTLVSSSLSNREQQVKLGPQYGDWAEIIKGVPQGSIQGPLLFNIFINDIFHILDRSSLYNYADDNTLSYAHSNPDTLIRILQEDCSATLRWFRVNRTALPLYDGSESTGLLCHPTMVQSQQDCSATLRWSRVNQMKANPDQFRAICFGRRGNSL